MGFFDKLFQKQQPAAPATSTKAKATTAEARAPDLNEILKMPPRLINEGPEFPHAPILLRRAVTAADVAAALAAAGFSQDGDRFSRDNTIIVRSSDEHGLQVLAFSGDEVVPVQRSILAVLAWVDPHTLYAELGDTHLAAVDVCYLLWATRHYRCAGGVPRALRTHPDATVAETIRLIDRAQMADAARAQRKK